MLCNKEKELLNLEAHIRKYLPMQKRIQTIIFLLLTFLKVSAQQFETIPKDVFSGMKPLTFKNILCTDKGSVLITNSIGVAEEDRMQIQVIFNNGNATDEKGKQMYFGKNSNIFKDIYELSEGIKLICKGPGNVIYVVSENNNFGFINYNEGNGIGFAPFNFPSSANQHIEIERIWMDNKGTLFVAANTDTIYSVTDANKIYKFNTDDKAFGYMSGLDKDSNFVVTIGARAVKKFNLGAGIIPFSFSQDQDDDRTLLIGTNKGLYAYDKKTGQYANYFKPPEAGTLTITDIQPETSGTIIWFCTLEKGMGRFNELSHTIQYYPYPKKNTSNNTIYPINNFSKLTDNTFIVAIADSVPAIFNKETGKYIFIDDSIFNHTENRTSDIKVDASGNMFITKGGGLYWSKTYVKNNAKNFVTDSSLFGPYITDITVNGMAYKDLINSYRRTDSLKEINLKYNENSIQILYACRGIDPDSLVFKWKLDNFSRDWMQVPFSVLNDKLNLLTFDYLHPGKYLLHIKAKSVHRDWLSNEAELVINIQPPFWQTWWFWATAIITISMIVFVVIKWRVKAVRKQERIKAKYEKETLELEAKALRAQMNPHFIFNCMNSIKALIQQKEEDRAVNYLTTFSKLLRTILHNCDKREITLFDELETCRLYTQLEEMRFGKKLCYSFQVEEGFDLKSIMVPALIMQPFIENAIWHGIMPVEEGGKLSIVVEKKNNVIYCIIDDNGIGREMSRQNKFKGESTHQSKGVHLTQARLDLDNLINERKASVEIIDKKDEHDKATGTTVILAFKEY